LRQQGGGKALAAYFSGQDGKTLISATSRESNAAIIILAEGHLSKAGMASQAVWASYPAPDFA
jgi:hypothetical protein